MEEQEFGVRLRRGCALFVLVVGEILMWEGTGFGST